MDFDMGGGRFKECLLSENGVFMCLWVVECGKLSSEKIENNLLRGVECLNTNKTKKKK